MKNEQESAFTAYLQAFVAQRVEELAVDAEKQREYIKGREAIQEIMDEVSKTVEAETLDTLISAVRGADVPIYEYMYRIGLKDGIWLSDRIDYIKKYKE